MLLILPPSETKRDGGREGSSLDVARLSFSELNLLRVQTIAALRTLSRDEDAAVKALKLGPTQRFEVLRNRALTTSPVMPALDRYTGVVYDALDAATLAPSARAFADRHLIIQSALFGLLAAPDQIPAYRLSHDSRLPQISLGRHWRAHVSQVLQRQNGLVLDLRSEAYVSFGPVDHGYYVHVVAEGADGRRSALSHFNKKAKGDFTRAVLDAGVDHNSVVSLIEWAASKDIRLENGEGRVLYLIV